MAVPSLPLPAPVAPAPFDPYCPVHHQASALCPPPDLADVLPLLGEVHPAVEVTIVGPVAVLDECGSCSEQADWWVRGTAVAIVWHRSREDRFTYSETCCAGCLSYVIAEYIRQGFRPWVHVPAEQAVA